MRKWILVVTAGVLLACVSLGATQEESKVEKLIKDLGDKIVKLERKVDELTKKIEKLEKEKRPLRSFEEKVRELMERFEDQMGRFREEDFERLFERFRDGVPDEFRALPDMFRDMDLNDLMERLREYLESQDGDFFREFDFEKFKDPPKPRPRIPDNEVSWR